MSIVGVDAGHIGPDDQFAGIDHVSDKRARKIRAVSAKSGHTTIAGGADKSSDDGNQAMIEKREKKFAAAASCLLHVWPSTAKRVAGQNKFGRIERNGAQAVFCESGGEQWLAKTLAVGRQPILQGGA